MSKKYNYKEVFYLKKPNLLTIVEFLEKELLKQGYSQSTMQFYNTAWKKIIKYFNSKGITYYSEELLLEFLEDVYQISKKKELGSITSYEISMIRAACLLGDFSQNGNFLRKYYKKPIITNEKQLAVVAQFEQACINNGNREDTASAKGRNVCQMLKYFSDNGINEICDISPEIIERYILTFSRYAKNGIHKRVGHLKAFFAFLYQTNYLKTDYSKIFPTYNAPRNAKIPCVWKHDDVVKMLEVVDRGNPSGKRDYAILMLVTHLGLRIGDVKSLKFDNFKWNTNRLEIIQSKTGEFLSLPLSREVGWAVIDYIQNGRPLVDTDVIFVRHCAPYCGFCKGNSLGAIIDKYRKLAHLPSVNHPIGMHSLRHTLASRLLKNEVPLDVISDILGHQSVDTTDIYLKVDIDSLRMCALQPPEVKIYE